MAGRYMCGTCGSEGEELRINGTLKKHNTLVVSRGGMIRRSEQVCTGTGEPAELVEDVELAPVGAERG